MLTPNEHVATMEKRALSLNWARQELTLEITGKCCNRSYNSKLIFDGFKFWETLIGCQYVTAMISRL